MGTAPEPVIGIHLADVKHMFDEPEFDPFARHQTFSSGIDQLVRAPRVSSLQGRASVTIYLPSDQVVSGIGEALRAAIDQYCTLRIREDDRENESARWDALRSIPFGLGLVAVCWLLAFLGGEAGDAGLLSKSLSNFVREGFLLIGVLVVWSFGDMLLAAWWPRFREKQLYGYIIHQTDLTIAPEG